MNKKKNSKPLSELEKQICPKVLKSAKIKSKKILSEMTSEQLENHQLSMMAEDALTL